MNQLVQQYPIISATLCTALLFALTVAISRAVYNHFFALALGREGTKYTAWNELYNILRLDVPLTKAGVVSTTVDLKALALPGSAINSLTGELQHILNEIDLIGRWSTRVQIAHDERRIMAMIVAFSLIGAGIGLIISLYEGVYHLLGYFSVLNVILNASIMGYLGSLHVRYTQIRARIALLSSSLPPMREARLI